MAALLATVIGEASHPAANEESVTEPRAVELLRSLEDKLVSLEGATKFCFALDLEPEADIAQVRQILDEWQCQGWIEYETCEARVAGSFDDRPSEASHE